MERETDKQFLARGLRKALTGQGRFTEQDFERLDSIEKGEPEPAPEFDAHTRPS
jgi:hypothetical protein